MLIGTRFVNRVQSNLRTTALYMEAALGITITLLFPTGDRYVQL